MSGAPARSFYKGKRVLITGHTGFKGAWLSLWLESLGARLAGLALAPEGPDWLYEKAKLAKSMESVLADVRDEKALSGIFKSFKPQIVFHLAAQPLVRRSYREPAETFSVNVQGTACLLDAARACPAVEQVVVVTSDKCYRDSATRPCRENDALGGRDPYSASKAATELVAASYRSSYFSDGQAALATARAGNVIGGGDRAEDRIIPDLVRALEAGKPVILRNPSSVRPWQHVLEPLSGYLLLAERLAQSPKAFAEAWNFGPDEDAPLTVLQLVDAAIKSWGSGSRKIEQDPAAPYEAPALRLDSSKARERLGWRPVYGAGEAAAATMEWYRRARDGEDARALTLSQIGAYEGRRCPA